MVDEAMSISKKAASGRIALSKRDTLRVLDLLQNPPKPTPVLLAAARRRFAASDRGPRQG
jgi:uncharacterized protein (DUF1778 family)